jgi:hypothetical protein
MRGYYGAFRARPRNHQSFASRRSRTAKGLATAPEVKATDRKRGAGVSRAWPPFVQPPRCYPSAALEAA